MQNRRNESLRYRDLGLVCPPHPSFKGGFSVWGLGIFVCLLLGVLFVSCHLSSLPVPPVELALPPQLSCLAKSLWGSEALIFQIHMINSVPAHIMSFYGVSSAVKYINKVLGKPNLQTEELIHAKKLLKSSPGHQLIQHQLAELCLWHRKAQKVFTCLLSPY